MSAHAKQQAQLPVAGVHTAHVTATAEESCRITVGNIDVPAHIATHIPQLAAGQKVLAHLDEQGDWLVVAAWPSRDVKPFLRFDPGTGTLLIEAARLQLKGVAGVELRCQDGVVQLGMDGKVQIQGTEILSSAQGSHRIEGGSIDLN